jgi:hypothetical protein
MDYYSKGNNLPRQVGDNLAYLGTFAYHSYFVAAALLIDSIFLGSISIPFS